MTTEMTTITARGQKAIDKYFKAIDKAKASAWGIAKVVSDTVKAETFDADFGSMSVYANAIGLSKASISMQVRAYNMYNDNACLDGFTYTAVAFLLPLEKANVEIEQFIESRDIDSTTSASTVKKAVRDYLSALEDKSEETEAGETDGEENEAEVVTEESRIEETESVDSYNVPVGMDFLVINGDVFELSEDDIEKVKEVLGL